MIEDLPDEEKARMLFGMRYADTLARGFSTQVYRDSEGHLVAGWGQSWHTFFALFVCKSWFRNAQNLANPPKTF